MINSLIFYDRRCKGHGNDMHQLIRKRRKIDQIMLRHHFGIAIDSLINCATARGQSTAETQIPRCTMDISGRVRLTGKQRLYVIAAALHTLHPSDDQLRTPRGEFVQWLVF